MFDRVIDERRTDCFASQVVLSDQLEGYIQTEPTPVDVLPLQEVVQNILTPIDEGRKTLAAEKMKRRNLQQRPDQHREQNLPEWLFFHFGPVIGVGIVALDHYRLQNHHPGMYSNFISML